MRATAALRVARHLGWLLRHHIDGRHAAAGALAPPRPAALEIVALPARWPATHG